MLKIYLKGLLLLAFPFSVFANQSLDLGGSQTFKLSAGLDHNSYYNSGVTVSGIGFGVNAESGQYKLNAFGLINKQEGLESNTNFSWSIPEAFYSLNKSKENKFIIGRKKFEATDLEDLELVGFWNNAWDFRKDNPQLEGLTGLFYERKTDKFKAQFFTSALSLPKLTQHYEFDDVGGITATTPWFGLPPEEINYSGNKYNVKYFLEDIDYVDLVLKPQVGFNMKFNTESFSTKLSYLYAPSKDLDIGLSFLVDASSVDTPIEVSISPEASYLHKFGSETSVEIFKGTKTTLSISAQVRENKLKEEANISWLGIGNGVYSFLAHEFGIFKSQAKVFATFNTISMNSTGELDEVLEDSLSVSYRFDTGVGASFGKKLSARTSLNLFGYVDLENEGALGRVSLKSSYRKYQAEFGMSFIEALSSKSTSFYKDYRENDSLFTRVSYVF